MNEIQIHQFMAKLHCNFYGQIETEIFTSSNKFLEHSDIALVKIFLPDYESIVDDLSLFLDLVEIDRAKRYYNKKDRNRFIICRGLLKFALSLCTRSDISNIKINYHNNKKPYLASHPSLFFNVSHSEEYALIALSNSAIGVDIEYMNENYDFVNSLPYIFNTPEISFIEKAINKKFAFYSLWTRKEAFVKALGKGIDDDFQKVPCMDGIHTIDTPPLNDSAKSWQTHGFYISENYIGALAFELKASDAVKILAFTLPNKIQDLKGILLY